MSNFMHPIFGPGRVATSGGPLEPPLKLIDEWSMEHVAYPPLVTEKHVFVSISMGEIRALDPLSKEVTWVRSLPGPFELPIPFHGALFLTEMGLISHWKDHMFHLDHETGKVINEFTTPPLRLPRGAIVGSYAIGIFSSDDRRWCGCFDLQDKCLVWRQPLEAPVMTTLTVTSSCVGIDNGQGTYLCLDTATGDERWRFDVAGLGEWRDVLKRTRRTSLAGWGLASHDYLVLPIVGHPILAFDFPTGATRWSLEIPMQNPGCSVMDRNGTLYLIGSEWFLSINTHEGQIIRAENHKRAYSLVGSLMFGCPSLSDNHIFAVDCRRGTLAALDRNDGTVAWSYETGAHFRAWDPPVIAQGHLFLVDDEGNLRIFEPA